MEHLGGRVGEEAEGEFVLGAEAGVGLGAVLAHAYYVVAGGGQFGVVVAEGAVRHEVSDFEHMGVI